MATPLKVYTSRILADLKVSSSVFSDVEIVVSGCEGRIVTSSLVLASLSPMIRTALQPLAFENVEEKMKIILEDIDFDNAKELFENVLYCETEDYMVDQKYLEILEYFGVSLDFETASATLPPPKTVVMLKHDCNVCKKSFTMKKLLARHIRTFHSENNPNKCLDCGRPCRSQSELKIHQRVHTKERPHQCPKCPKAFTQVSHLNEHLNSVHQSSNADDDLDMISKNICEVCGLVLSSRGAVMRHSKIHQSPNRQEMNPHDDFGEAEEEEDANMMEEEDEIKAPQFICDVEGCEKVLRTQTSLKLHKASHLNEKPFSCDICEKSFTQKSHLTVHQRVHSGAKPHMCSYCGKQFSIKSNMKKHVKMHEDKSVLMKENLIKNSPFVCEFCGKAFAALYELDLHVKSHTHDKPYECLVCGAAFANRSAMRIHEKIHTGEALQKCNHCDLACVSKSALDKHMLTHTGEKPFSCDHCGKSFKQKSHVNYHVKTVHGGILPKDRPRNHYCFHCGSAFTTASTLRKHMKIHTEERPHVCKFCSKGFIQKVHLQTHLLRHSGDKPWLCNVCGKGFVTNAVLKEHSKLHTGTKKSFGCGLCDAKYANLVDLKIHEKRHTGEMPYKCEKCVKAFRSKRLLQEHERTHYDIKPFACVNCGKSFATASGLRQHFKRHDTCKLSALPGIFSIQDDLTKVESSSESALLVDFLPRADLGQDVILIDNQSFTLSALPQ